jgi:hypothetical protein
LLFFYSRQKFPYESTISHDVGAVAHNLIHIKCVEVRGRPGGVIPACGGPGLRLFYAWRKYAYKSRGWGVWSSLANNLIHKFCAEVHNPAASGLKVMLWISTLGSKPSRDHSCRFFAQAHKAD